ncbi:hypothetical protein [Lysinibacillus sp. NPDC056232]|uniref:hypothetical protein n=1 Tax=Lysinibacillus sp. NPDC056232 TaxID=3345756 RepID=UPI0035DEA397
MLNICDVYMLIGVEARRLLGDQRLIGRPQEALLCAKAKRQPERKSTSLFDDKHYK